MTEETKSQAKRTKTQRDAIISGTSGNMAQEKIRDKSIAIKEVNSESPLAATEKFSEFPNGGQVQTNDQVVGLRGGDNTRFSLNTVLSNISTLQTNVSTLDGEVSTLNEEVSTLQNNFAETITTNTILTFPLPTFITANFAAPGGTIQLPDMTLADATGPGQMPIIYCQGQPCELLDFDGTTIHTFNTNEAQKLQILSYASQAGTFAFQPVQLLTKVGSDQISGVVIMSSSDDTMELDASSNNTVDFSAWALLRDKLLNGTNITIAKDNIAKTATVSSSGTPFSVGAGAAFNIMSGATTSFTGGTPIPAVFTVANSSATNMTVASNGTITCSADGAGKYAIAFSMSAKSSASTNTFFFYVAKNGTADTGSLIPITLPTAPGNGGYQVVVIFKEDLNPGDTLRLFVANSSGTPTANDLIIQNMLCNCSLDLEASSNLQSSWGNGGTIQGDLDANPVDIQNSSSETVLKVTEGFADLPKNYGNWTPTFSNLVGITGSITLGTARWFRQGDGVICAISGEFTASDSDISFDITLPVAPGFTGTDQVNYVGGNVYAVPPTVADGNVVSYKSNSPDDTVTAVLNATVGAGDFDFNLSFLYEVQP